MWPQRKRFSHDGIRGAIIAFKKEAILASNQPAAAGSLLQKSCKACEGKVVRLTDDQVKSYLGQIPDWAREGNEIALSFKFKNYYETMAAVNAVAWISHREDHHPDMKVGYNTCQIRYSTHSVGGLSENDFICAAKVDALM